MVRDLPLAVLLTVTAQIELLLAAEQVTGPRALQHLVFAAATVPLAVRRSRPVAAAVAVGVALAAQAVLGPAPAAGGYLALLFVAYSVARHTDRRRAALLGLAALLLDAVVYPLAQPERATVADGVVNVVIVAAVWLLARIGREQSDRAVAAERAAMQLTVDAAEESARHAERVAAERRRIARECHDVIGHGVTLMLLHAEGAQARLGAREPEVRAALDVVTTAGRTALQDMHEVVRVLRGPGERADKARDDEGRGVDDLPELVARAGTARPGVDLQVTGAATPLPATVATTAYRVVQEGLTNALRHTRDGPIEVVLRYADEALHVDVLDRGAPTGDGSPGAAGGRGLAGLRERVAVVGGRFCAGPRPDAPGWRLSAVLPVRAGGA